MEKMLLKPLEVAEVLSLGRSNIYALLASGELPSIRIGGSVRVPIAALKAWIAQQLAEQQAAEPSEANGQETKSHEPPADVH